MKKIYKYYINFKDHAEETKLHVPADSILLHIDKQSNSIYAWFEVNAEEELDDICEFVCIHTGESFDASNLIFRKTVVFNERYVVHIYEKKKFLEKEDFNVD